MPIPLSPLTIAGPKLGPGALRAARTAPPPGTDRARRPTDRPRSVGSADAAGVMFDALLAGARMLMSVARGSTARKTSPSQMFEADVADPRQRHETMRQRESRAQTDRLLTADRYDRTSVEGRRTQQPGRPGDARGAARSSERPTGPPAGSTEAKTALEGQRLSLRGLFPSPPGDSPLRAAGPSVRDPRSNPMDRTIGARPADPAAPTASAGPGGASVNRVARAAPDGGSPAQRVAQLLGASRAGGAESTRAPAPPSGPAAGQTSAPSVPRDAEPRTRAGRDVPTPSRFPFTTPDRADRPFSMIGGPAFDELVRSIRLYSGSSDGFLGAAQLDLKPPELGRMRVGLRLVRGKVQIDVRTETAEARRLMQDRAAELAASLERHGLDVERFEVTTAPVPDDGFGAPGGGFEQAAAEDEDRGAERDSEGAGAAPRGDPDRAERQRVVAAESRVDIRV